MGCAVASHLTCVGSSVEQLRAYLSAAAKVGIENIVALRGDPPRGETSFQPVAGGLRYANELVALIRREFPEFGIAVAGYPETHQEAPSPEADLENLQRKVDSRRRRRHHASCFTTTPIFSASASAARRIGISVPIVPGILPVTNFAQIQRIASLCKARLPDELMKPLERPAMTKPSSSKSAWNTPSGKCES